MINQNKINSMAAVGEPEQCIASGQGTAAQVEAHRLVGEPVTQMWVVYTPCHGYDHPPTPGAVAPTDVQIERVALAKGFSRKQQPDGTMALNPYVFDFARDLLKQFTAWNTRTSATSDTAGWQPIATAPQDGTVIDLWDTCKFSSGRLCFMQAVTHHTGNPYYSAIKGQSGRFCVRSTAHGGTVSHWMPSPQSPAAAIAAEGSQNG